MVAGDPELATIRFPLNDSVPVPVIWVAVVRSAVGEGNVIDCLGEAALSQRCAGREKQVGCVR